ncbi:hypothetical protein CASFOL_008190 [Castilleja foliolosa]|uniref:CCHC-type domain-containing protein n=1 Tax=Castilleja foliolosa TaxID=1961234 RepID=A0ABD3DZY9_9LAMI
MGKREKNAKSLEKSSSKEDRKKRKVPIEAADGDDDDAEANEDLSLKIVQKSIQRASKNNPLENGVSEIVTDLKVETKKKEKKKRKKSKETEVHQVSVSSDIDSGFRDFCGDLVDNVKEEEKPETNKATVVSVKSVEMDNVKEEEKPETTIATDVSGKSVEMSPVEVPDNVVMKKLLRGPRYFDPPDNNCGACYNCGEEGHTAFNCTSAKRKKPCFICGDFDHNAKQCNKGRDCFICKQQGHRAKDCPEKYNNSKICLKCGDLGHDMFSCRNDYNPDDIKEIQCYICQKVGHLCCINSSDPGPTEVSCYRCGLSGHTGLACMASFGVDTYNDTAAPSSCFKCGVEGHFARECTNSTKGQLVRELVNHQPRSKNLLGVSKGHPRRVRTVTNTILYLMILARNKKRNHLIVGSSLRTRKRNTGVVGPLNTLEIMAIIQIQIIGDPRVTHRVTEDIGSTVLTVIMRLVPIRPESQAGLILMIRRTMAHPDLINSRGIRLQDSLITVMTAEEGILIGGRGIFIKEMDEIFI